MTGPLRPRHYSRSRSATIGRRDIAAWAKNDPDGQEAALIAGTRPDVPTWGIEPTTRWGRLETGDRSEAVPSEPGAYPRYYAAVVAALRHGGPPPVDPEDAVRGLEIIAAARRSAAESVTIAVHGAS